MVDASGALGSKRLGARLLGFGGLWFGITLHKYFAYWDLIG